MKRPVLTLKKPKASSETTASKKVPAQPQIKPSNVFPKPSHKKIRQKNTSQKPQQKTPPKADQKKSLQKKPSQKKKSAYAVYQSHLQMVIWLEKTYPRLFDTKNVKPLEKGIIKHLLTQGPFPHSHKRIRQGVRLYTSFRAYHEALIKGTHRYTLEGEISEPLTEDEKAYSQEILNQRKLRKDKIKIASSPSSHEILPSDLDMSKNRGET